MLETSIMPVYAWIICMNGKWTLILCMHALLCVKPNMLNILMVEDTAGGDF